MHQFDVSSAFDQSTVETQLCENLVVTAWNLESIKLSFCLPISHSFSTYGCGRSFLFTWPCRVPISYRRLIDRPIDGRVEMNAHRKENINRGRRSPRGRMRSNKSKDDASACIGRGTYLLTYSSAHGRLTSSTYLELSGGTQFAVDDQPDRLLGNASLTYTFKGYGVTVVKFSLGANRLTRYNTHFPR